MKIGWIGSGAVAKGMSLYLCKEGFSEQVFYSRNFNHAKEASENIGARAVRKLKSLVEESELIFIAVSDREITNVVSQIIDLKMNLSQRKFLHTSGAESSKVLLPLEKHGAKIGSLHPLQSFTDFRRSSNQMKTTLFSYEGDLDETLDYFFKQASIRFFRIKPEDKPQYHLAAVVASNYLTATIHFAVKKMMALGIDEQTALQALSPLIDGTLENIKHVGTRQALTGPLIRGDEETIQKHMKVLDGDDLNFYCALGKEALAISKVRGLNEQDWHSLHELLSGGKK